MIFETPVPPSFTGLLTRLFTGSLYEVVYGGLPLRDTLFARRDMIEGFFFWFNIFKRYFPGSMDI